MFEGKASQTYLHEYRYENWGQHEFTKGTWTQAFMERKSALKELNQPLDKKSILLEKYMIFTIRWVCLGLFFQDTMQ